MPKLDGAAGWDAYARFYDWENARTLGRRDVAFWRRVVSREQAAVLELGCGTGRLLAPLSRTGVPVTGVDLSAPMLARARARLRRVPAVSRGAIVRADIRRLPFANATFGVALAPYGMLQSLVRDRDLDATLAEAHRVLQRGGLLGIDLVPDLPAWQEFRRQVRLRGRDGNGRRITLIESVRQDRRRGLTIFDEEFVEAGPVSRGRATRRTFQLVFRTLKMPAMIARLERHGFRADVMLGDYQDGPWDPRAETWIVLARRE